ncbi:DNA-binding protein [Romboutsia sedimentorum]|jgi:predicted HicB family RNase H-like nuclease|uniref:DNA-binding protein n=1 Tax=Romboutsia sedimentorum TaxID=1368474 RepID=A0ABT7E5H6_9FIRM|nr:DNA-binding protein [Romboutsia sedimentorum]MDK2562183.1 DNA-binding protein [Romboutsia sedimentorum]MDK2584419.1 DNA-binding protein [Romboutsia sedimentorum]
MINKEVNVRTSLTIPKNLKSKLEILAKDDHISVNNLIIKALDKYVKDEFDNMHNKME